MFEKRMNWVKDNTKPKLNQRVLIWCQHGNNFTPFATMGFWGQQDGDKEPRFYDSPQFAHFISYATYWAPIISPDGEELFE